MSLEAFDSTVKPRVIGTINLHKAVEHSPLDFFLMWSSWTAIFGTATQTNYIASCSFLDAFARHRRSLGLPATSLSLSRIGNVGAIARRAGYANALARNGIYGNSEWEFLQYCEAALGGQQEPSTKQASQFSYDGLSTAHLLAGIDPTGLADLSKTHPLKDMGWYRDLRFSNLLQAVELLSSHETTSVQVSDDAEGGKPVDRIRAKAAQLLYVDVDSIDVKRAIAEYGIDSMIAAELRNWMLEAFGTTGGGAEGGLDGEKVSMFGILSHGMTIARIAENLGGSKN